MKTPTKISELDNLISSKDYHALNTAYVADFINAYKKETKQMFTQEIQGADYYGALYYNEIDLLFVWHPYESDGFERKYSDLVYYYRKPIDDRIVVDFMDNFIYKFKDYSDDIVKQYIFEIHPDRRTFNGTFLPISLKQTYPKPEVKGLSDEFDWILTNKETGEVLIASVRPQA